MHLIPILALIVSLIFSPTIRAQGNAQLVSTWSSGSTAVRTGSGFANPANLSFTYPANAGISYSFTIDGYYEIARYRFVGNGSQPSCIIGVINWCHGTYVVNANGSISMTPFGDGYQQIQDACAAVSNVMQNYNETEYYTGWSIETDPVIGSYLQLYQYDGSPLAPQIPVSSTPDMLPTQSLRNVTPAYTTVDGVTQQVLAVTSGERRLSSSSTVALVITMFGLGLASSLL